MHLHTNVTLAVVLMASSLAVACRDDDADGDPEPADTATPFARVAGTPQPQVTVTAFAHAFYNTHSGRSIEEMFAAYPYVFIGRVESVDSLWVESGPTPQPVDQRVPLPTHPALGSAKPPRTKPLTLPVSEYTIVVEQVFAGTIESGDTVTLFQDGGVFEEPDGSLSGWRLEGDPLIDVGRRYLLFASMSTGRQFVTPPRREGMLWAPPWGRFEVTGEGLVPHIEMNLPAQAELRGRSESMLDSLLHGHGSLP